MKAQKRMNAFPFAAIILLLLPLGLKAQDQPPAPAEIRVQTLFEREGQILKQDTLIKHASAQSVWELLENAHQDSSYTDTLGRRVIILNGVSFFGLYQYRGKQLDELPDSLRNKVLAALTIAQLDLFGPDSLGSSHAGQLFPQLPNKTRSDAPTMDKIILEHEAQEAHEIDWQPKNPSDTLRVSVSGSRISKEIILSPQSGSPSLILDPENLDPATREQFVRALEDTTLREALSGLEMDLEIKKAPGADNTVPLAKVRMAPLSPSEIQRIAGKSPEEEGNLDIDPIQFRPIEVGNAFLLSFHLPQAGPVEVKVLDAGFRPIFQESRSQAQGIYSRKIDFKQQVRGTYFISILQNHKIYCKKLVIE